MRGDATSRDYSLPWYSRVFRPVSRAFFRILFRLLSRVHNTGVENIPEEGAHIAAGNHDSIFEPPLIAAVRPCPIELPEIPWRSAERKDILHLQSERIMNAIADLLPSAYQGWYARGS